MMRIRIPNGISSAAQLRTIGRIANRVGRGIADITTRQQIQLRWIRINDVPPILEELREVGLVTLQTGMDNIRNVVGCAVAGLTPNELFDASPVARAFTDTVVGDVAYTNLPRKFNVTITGCRENCTHAETQDVALVPATKSLGGETVSGFNVLVGGKNGSGGYRIATPLDIFVPPEEAPELCSAIVLLFRDHGSREARNKVRLAFLVEEWGEAKFHDALEGGLVSCTGIEFCNLAVIETKARALQIARTLETKVHHGKPIRIHWSGCPAGCGNHTVADIGLLGVKAKVDGQAVDAVDVFVGGSSGPHAIQGIRILEGVPCETLPETLEGLIRHLEPDKVRRQLRALSESTPAPNHENAAKPVMVVDELQEGTSKALTMNGTEVAVFRCGNQLYALQNRCPHAGGSLADGTVEGDEVICPLHGYRFNIRTGACVTDPALRAKSVALVPHADGFTGAP